jgi:hypothetical protein
MTACRVTAAAVLALAASAAPAAAAPAPEGDEAAGPVVERAAVDVAPANGTSISRVEIDNRLGDVRIKGRDREGVTVFAVKHAPDDATLDRLKVSLVPDPAGPLRIATSLLVGDEARPVPAGSVRIDLVIYAPREATAVAHVWKGHVQVTSMDNGAELVANDGDIRVTNVSGAIETHSVHGDQEFERVFGDIDAQGMAGRLALQQVRGNRLDAFLHRGRITARQVRVKHVAIRTTRADIELRGRAIPGGHYEIVSYGGDLDIRLAGDASLSIAATAPDGRVVLPQSLGAARGEDGRYTAVVARGGQPAAVEVHSRHGNIRFAVLSR